jgi:hypothetical protein
LTDYFFAGSPSHQASSGLEGRNYFLTNHQLSLATRSFASQHQLRRPQPNHLVCFYRQHHQRMEHPPILSRLAIGPVKIAARRELVSATSNSRDLTIFSTACKEQT